MAIAHTDGEDVQERVADCEFIALLKTYMQEAGVENRHQLYRVLKGYGPPSSRKSVSWPTVKAYFNGTKTPQPWFVLACIDVLRLNKRKACELALACLRSYYTPGRFED